ncbi:MAG: UDP-2,3-diacylglucosamine diphosphatase [Bacteroidales bacterium]|nr:UDP-2,3-diacylglucosamine diphosphatase [Bacteroidales bacterium]
MKSSEDPIIIQGNACFVSDMHFAVPADDESRFREELLIQLFHQLSDQIQHLFLLGDIFDFWFEYQDVMPKGYFKLFNTLYDLRCKGVQIYYFTGNHDMWLQDFFPEQLGCQVFHDPRQFVINGKRCLVGHGDGVGGKQLGYRFIKSVFAFKPNQFVYSMLHPRIAFGIARFVSYKSRISHEPQEMVFRDEDEPQIRYARQVLQNDPIDLFIFAHLHLPKRYVLTDQSTYFNCGDWLTHKSYLLFSSNQAEPTLCNFNEEIDHE